MAALRRLAEQIEGEGRHGDSEIVHMSPEEIAALEEMLGPMTVNPETGQPEAFSWKKLLLGLASVAAGPFTGGLSLLGLGALPFVGGGDKKDEEFKASEAGAYAKKYAADQAKGMYNFPQTTVLNPAAKINDLGKTPQWFDYVKPMSGGISSLMNPPETARYAEGGALEPEEMEAHNVMAEAIAAIEGKSPNPEKAINDFIAMFGKEALMELMQGNAIKGPGAGMDDMIPGTLDGNQKLLVSNDEHIIPADAVAHLGDGSSDAGHNRLDAMIGRARMAKTGRPQQPGKLAPEEVMPV